jgi:hypothetical protein
MRKLVATAVIAAFGIAGIAPAMAADAATVTLTGGSKAVVNVLPDTLVATTNSIGTVEYKADGKSIAGCDKVATTTVTPFVAKCTWLPTVASKVALTAVFTPADTTVVAATSNTVTAAVGSPTQGIVSPISIYADTVLASGSTGVLAPRFSACAVQSEYLLGQTIVFRVYANNADLGGAVMDNSNTAKAYIEIAGVKDPITLSYGNHSGISFWTATLKTGSTAGLYSTLGVINYKVTMVAKDTTTAKVLATKRQQVTENGVTVWKWVSYYKDKKLTWPIIGATGTLVPNWTATSLLTLYAAPVAK